MTVSDLANAAHCCTPTRRQPNPRPANYLSVSPEASESNARTYGRHFPIRPVSAHGATLIDEAGREYLDCLAGAGALPLGHNHPEVVDAVQELLCTGAPLHTLDFATPVKDAFILTLLDVLPGELRGNAKIHFCSPAGTDAVEAAIKIAQIATGRKGIFAFTGAFHGMTTGSSAVSGPSQMRERTFAELLPITRIPFPARYRNPFPQHGIDPGDAWEDAGRVSLDLMAAYLDDPSSGVSRPAAILIEAIQGEGGVVPAPHRFLRDLREFATAHNILLIADEVQSGIGRTGSMWACDHPKVTPDILVTSKALGGGLPLAVVAYREGLDQWNPGDHTGTFRGSALSLTAARSTLDIILREGVVQNAARLGDFLKAGLNDLAAQYPQVGDVRGSGLMLGLELIDPASTPDRHGYPKADPALARDLRGACFDRGMIVELGGREDTVLRLLPPLNISETQAALALEIIGSALRDVVE